MRYDYDSIDFQKDVTREHINEKVYESKFAFVDKVLSLKNPHPKYWKEIAEDPTMKAYAFLRLDGKPMKLYPYQDLIINDKHRFKYFRAANQIGKSLFLDVDAIVNFISDHGHAFNIAIVSKSLQQSGHQMRRIRSLLNSMEGLNWRESKGSTDNTTVISIDFTDEKGKYKYSNLIIIVPCTEGLLGYDLHKLYLDEFEFWEVDTEYFFYQIAQPRTYTTKGDIIITTNPNGQDSFGAELEAQTDKDGKRKWHVYVFNYLDRPGNTQEEYDNLKHELPREKFESTVAAIRSISDKNYFTPDEIERSEDRNLTELSMVGKQPFAFLDVGAKKDASVLVMGYIEPDKEGKFNHIYIPIIHRYPIGYPLTKVVGVSGEAQDGDGWHHEKSVKEHLQEWSAEGIIPVFGVDVTGNTGISPLFTTAGIEPYDITFSGPVKSGMYQRFKYFMEKGLLHRKKDKQFDYEARHLQMRKSVRGYLMIHHEKEDDHDDIMDAVAGLIHLADPNYVPTTMKMF